MVYPDSISPAAIYSDPNYPFDEPSYTSNPNTKQKPSRILKTRGRLFAVFSGFLRQARNRKLIRPFPDG